MEYRAGVAIIVHVERQREVYAARHWVHTPKPPAGRVIPPGPQVLLAGAAVEALAVVEQLRDGRGRVEAHGVAVGVVSEGLRPRAAAGRDKRRVQQGGRGSGVQPPRRAVGVLEVDRPGRRRVLRHVLTRHIRPDDVRRLLDDRVGIVPVRLLQRLAVAGQVVVVDQIRRRHGLLARPGRLGNPVAGIVVGELGDCRVTDRGGARHAGEPASQVAMITD